MPPSTEYLANNHSVLYHGCKRGPHIKLTGPAPTTTEVMFAANKALDIPEEDLSDLESWKPDSDDPSEHFESMHTSPPTQKPVCGSQQCCVHSEQFCQSNTHSVHEFKYTSRDSSEYLACGQVLYSVSFTIRRNLPLITTGPSSI